MDQDIKPVFKAAPIKTRERLIAALDVSPKEMEDALSLSLDVRYRKLKNPIYKSDGVERKVFNPHPVLRKIQRRINRRINSCCIRWPDYLFGALPKTRSNGTRDYVECARQHVEAKSILSIDVSNFYDQIHKDYVFEVFRNLFRYSESVSKDLTNLCCRGDYLVQGALTSSYLGMLILWDVEFQLVQRLRRSGLTYTRLIDDINISSKSHNFDFSGALRLAEEMLLEKGLITNKSKTVIQRVGTSPLLVHGLKVSDQRPTFTKQEVKKIRAAVHQITTRARDTKDVKSKTYREEYFRILGRVNKLSRVNHDKHGRLLKALRHDDVRPRPSNSDIRSVRARIKSLENAYDQQHDQYQYYRRYNITVHLLNFILKEGSQQSPTLQRLANLKPQLAAIKPSYKSERSYDPNQ